VNSRLDENFDLHYRRIPNTKGWIAMSLWQMRGTAMGTLAILLLGLTIAIRYVNSVPIGGRSGITPMTDVEMSRATGRNWGNCWVQSSSNCLLPQSGCTAPTDTCTVANNCVGISVSAPSGPAPYYFCYNNGNPSTACTQDNATCETGTLKKCSMTVGGGCAGGKTLPPYGCGVSSTVKDTSSQYQCPG